MKENEFFENKLAPFDRLRSAPVWMVRLGQIYMSKIITQLLINYLFTFGTSVLTSGVSLC